MLKGDTLSNSVTQQSTVCNISTHCCALISLYTACPEYPDHAEATVFSSPFTVTHKTLQPLHAYHYSVYVGCVAWESLMESKLKWQTVSPFSGGQRSLIVQSVIFFIGKCTWCKFVRFFLIKSNDVPQLMLAV